MYAIFFSLFLLFSLPTMEAKGTSQKRTTHVKGSKKTNKKVKASNKKRSKAKNSRRKPIKKNADNKVAATTFQRRTASKAPITQVVSGKIPLPKQAEYQPIVNQTDTYAYSVKRITNEKVVIYLEFPTFTFVPEVSAAVESEISNPIDAFVNDLKHPVVTVDAPYKAINKAKITVESDYIVDVSLPLFGPFKAHDLSVHFIAEQKNK